MSKIAIVQFDDRTDQEIGPMRVLVARNGDYADTYGYHHVFVRQFKKNVPPYWYKVYLVDEYLASGFDTVVWLDSDVVVHDFSIWIESFLANQEAFVFSGDLPIWKSSTPFNAGIFMCRGEFAKKLMKEWLLLYPPHLWTKKGNEWVCKDPRWSGPAYEQGSFTETLLPKYYGTPAFKQLPWKMLQNPYPLKESFTVHFQNTFRPNCMLYVHDLADMLGLSKRAEATIRAMIGAEG